MEVANWNSLHEENERKEAALVDLENMITCLQGEGDDLQRSVGAVKSQLAECEGKCKELTKKVANLNSLRKENQKKEDVLVDLRNTITHLKGEQMSRAS